VVQHKLVEMHRLVETARTYTRDVAARHARGEDVVADACLAKQTAVEACSHVVDEAVQLHGGAGYMRGAEVERHYRDARIFGIGEAWAPWASTSPVTGTRPPIRTSRCRQTTGR
jgi:acyl-CoA dehydrogenase